MFVRGIDLREVTLVERGADAIRVTFKNGNRRFINGDDAVEVWSAWALVGPSTGALWFAVRIACPSCRPCANRAHVGYGFRCRVMDKQLRGRGGLTLFLCGYATRPTVANRVQL